MIKLYPVDVGYSALKTINVDNSQRVSFPSVVGRSITGAGSYSFSENGLAIRLGDEKNFTPLGIEALETQRQATGQRDAGWVRRDEWLRLFLAGAGQVIDGDETVNVVTGLPVADHERYKGALKERLEGKSFTFQLRDRDEQTVTINNVLVPSQPYGTLFTAAFDAYGHSKDSKYSTGFGGILDTGGHTVNLLAVRAMTAVQNMTGSRPFGLLHALEPAAEEINAEFTRLGYTPHDVAKAMERGYIVAKGEQYQIDQYTDHHLREFTNAIVTFVNRTFARAGRLEWLLLSGGGVLAIDDYLVEALSADFGNVKLVDDPRWANVRGYRSIGRRADKNGGWE